MSHRFAEICFRTAGQLYLFDMGKLKLSEKERVVVETEHGIALGTVKSLRTAKKSPPANFKLYKVIRRATTEDLEQAARNKVREDEAFLYCKEKIDEHKLTMKLVRAEHLYSGSKLLFYFSADGRIDFRLLVRDLARHFRMRIEMRQIGVRDSAKLIGGIGPCGQELCCSRFLKDFNPVSIRMAKDQNLTLNPQKVSGVCGRLMCCLAYEQDVYQEMRKHLPRIGEQIETPDGMGMVRDVHALRATVQVLFMDAEPPYEEGYHLSELPGFEDSLEEIDKPLSTEEKASFKSKQKRRAKQGIEPLMEPRMQSRRRGPVQGQRSDIWEESLRKEVHESPFESIMPKMPQIKEEAVVPGRDKRTSELKKSLKQKRAVRTTSTEASKRSRLKPKTAPFSSRKRERTRPSTERERQPASSRPVSSKERQPSAGRLEPSKNQESLVESSLPKNPQKPKAEVEGLSLKERETREGQRRGRSSSQKRRSRRKSSRRGAREQETQENANEHISRQSRDTDRRNVERNKSSEQGVRKPRGSEQGVRKPRGSEQGVRKPRGSEQGVRKPRDSEQGVRKPRDSEQGQSAGKQEGVEPSSVNLNSMDKTDKVSELKRRPEHPSSRRRKRRRKNRPRGPKNDQS